MSKLTIAAALMFVLVPFLAWSQDDEAVSGLVTTIRKTALRGLPRPQGSMAAMIDPGTSLRWIMGQRAGKYVRVMIPKGPSGWVLESDIKIVAGASSTGGVSLPPAQACVTPPTLDACVATRPAGCSPVGSAHGLANQLKHTVPPDGTPLTLSFQSFAELQDAAVALVDEGVEIPPDQRDLIKSLQLSEGTFGEGSRVRLLAFLSDGTPHANTGESVNCNLTGQANNDIHLSVAETSNASEFAGIVVELIPQNRPAQWTAQKAGKLRGKLLMIEGGLFYDNLHFANGDAANPLPNQPKRFSLWEIHPVVSVMICKHSGNQCDPNIASDWKPF